MIAYAASCLCLLIAGLVAGTVLVLIFDFEGDDDFRPSAIRLRFAGWRRRDGYWWKNFRPGRPGPTAIYRVATADAAWCIETRYRTASK